MTINATVRVVNARNTMCNTTGQLGIVKEVRGDRVFVVQKQGMWRMWFNIDQVEVC